ncbi:hypothetical protein GGE65_001850 [Skermanella aerolata]|uniref:hypothetical protein n=1 Tax=Skermanella aerolata TaxID=393310 RepID=UPI003D1C003E
MSEGYILISTGPEKYFDMAIQAAKSMRLFDPMRPICIACDDERLLDSPKADIFTNKYLIPDDMLHLKGTEFHLFVNRMSPFDRTMYVDADCLIASSRIVAIWEKLKEYHVTFPGIERSSGFWRLEIPPLIERFGLEFIVQLNGGVFFFDRSPEAEDFFKVAQDFFINHRDVATVKHRKGGGFSNESIWGLTMAKTRMKIYPLSDCWNISTLKWSAWYIGEDPLSLHLTKSDSSYQPAICHFIGLGQGHCPNDLYAKFSEMINIQLNQKLPPQQTLKNA